LKQPLAAWAALALIAAGCGSAQAYVTPGAVTLDALTTPITNGQAQASYNLHFGSRPASLYVNFDGGAMNYVLQTADVGAQLKLATIGEAITAQSFANGVSPAQQAFGNTAAGRDFYLAGMVDTALLDPGEPSTFSSTWGGQHDLRFGWAHIAVSANGKATVLASAMAYGEPGIVVGSTQAVPEPGTFALMGAGLLGLVAAQMWRTRQTLSAQPADTPRADAR
jgi:hypothetical protein